MVPKFTEEEMGQFHLAVAQRFCDSVRERHERGDRGTMMGCVFEAMIDFQREGYAALALLAKPANVSLGTKNAVDLAEAADKRRTAKSGPSPYDPAHPDSPANQARKKR